MPFVPGFRKPDVRKRFASNAIGLNLGTGVIGSYCEERPIAMRRASHDRESNGKEACPSGIAATWEARV
jgi:hypothetical protein